MVKISVELCPTVEAIYRWHEARQNDGNREHLGASIIGRPCERQLWYTFRWTRKAKHTGRLLRLFQTGHLAEHRLVEELRATGVDVHQHDEEGNQFHVSAVNGHFGGSMDGAAIGIHAAPKKWHVLEFKTHGAKSFGELKSKGVRLAKPEHFAQMMVYMHLAGMERAFYLAVNKDTDELYSERVRYDAVEAERLMAKAGRIISSPNPLPRISEDPAFYLCRWCDHAEVCHGQAFPDRNCRTCIHSTPVEHGQWACGASMGEPIPVEKQRKGCHMQRYIPDLVPGTQVDTNGAEDERELVVEYQMQDGSTWADKGPE